MNKITQDRMFFLELKSDSNWLVTPISKLVNSNEVDKETKIKISSIVFEYYRLWQKGIICKKNDLWITFNCLNCQKDFCLFGDWKKTRLRVYGKVSDNESKFLCPQELCSQKVKKLRKELEKFYFSNLNPFIIRYCCSKFYNLEAKEAFFLYRVEKGITFFYKPEEEEKKLFMSQINNTTKWIEFDFDKTFSPNNFIDFVRAEVLKDICSECKKEKEVFLNNSSLDNTCLDCFVSYKENIKKRHLKINDNLEDDFSSTKKELFILKQIIDFFEQHKKKYEKI